LGIGTGGIRGITSGDIPLGLEELSAHNTYPLFGVWGLGFGVWGLATEEFGQLGPPKAPKVTEPEVIEIFGRAALTPVPSSQYDSYTFFYPKAHRSWQV
jgi:hypothetical protein